MYRVPPPITFGKVKKTETGLFLQKSATNDGENVEWNDVELIYAGRFKVEIEIQNVVDIFTFSRERPLRINSNIIDYREILSDIGKTSRDNFRKFLMFIISNAVKSHIDPEITKFINDERPTSLLPFYKSATYFEEYGYQLRLEVKGKKETIKGKKWTYTDRTLEEIKYRVKIKEFNRIYEDVIWKFLSTYYKTDVGTLKNKIHIPGTIVEGVDGRIASFIANKLDSIAVIDIVEIENNKTSQASKTCEPSEEKKYAITIVDYDKNKEHYLWSLLSNIYKMNESVLKSKIKIPGIIANNLKKDIAIAICKKLEDIGVKVKMTEL